MLRSLLGELSEEWVTRNEGPDTWSPRDVVAHLIHGEHEDWIERARIILDHGETRAFEPFDRFDFARFAVGKSTRELIEEFATLRERNLATLADLKLTEDRLALTGRHPAFGPVTLAQLMATWAVHDLAHIHQITRVLAKQYDLEVGPWKAYLGVLQQ